MCIKYAHSQGFHQKYWLLSNYRFILKLKTPASFLEFWWKEKTRVTKLKEFMNKFLHIFADYMHIGVIRLVYYAQTIKIKLILIFFRHKRRQTNIDR